MRGFDNHSINSQLLYALSLEEMTGAAGAQIYDRAKPHHTSFLRGATIAWASLPSGLPYLDLTPTPDFIDCPIAATADLDFIAGDFSGAIWVNLDTTGMLISRGDTDADGWFFEVVISRTLLLRTNQLGIGNHQDTDTDPFRPMVFGNWWLASFSRSGQNATIFINGVDVTLYPSGIHVDPDTSARELHIGVWDDETTGPLDGRIAGGPCCPRIWGRALASWEHRQIFNMERHWFL